MSLAEEHERWRAARLADLTKPDGWLSLVGLVWLDDGDYRVGRAPECEVSLGEAPLWGIVRVAHGRAGWHPAAGDAQALASDAPGPATVVRQGGASFFVIAREGRLALRLRDADSPTRRGFQGIDRFPFDPAWRLEAEWDGTHAQVRIGAAAMTLRPQDPDADPLHFVFADGTSGKATYGGGRFLYAAAAQGARLVLDFNRAINPPCAFTPFAVCPLPPADNRLPLAVTAGEKTWKP